MSGESLNFESKEKLECKMNQEKSIEAIKNAINLDNQDYQIEGITNLF